MNARCGSAIVPALCDHGESHGEEDGHVPGARRGTRPVCTSSLSWVDRGLSGMSIAVLRVQSLDDRKPLKIMTIKRLVLIIGAALFGMIVNIGLSILYIALYSYIINPGHGEKFYQEYAVKVVPYCAIITGVPVLYFVCRWIAGKWESDFAIKAALSVWLVYALVDLSVMTAAGWTVQSAIFSMVSMTTKLIAAHLGGSAARRKTN
jgi:hypothetical protein